MQALSLLSVTREPKMGIPMQSIRSSAEPLTARLMTIPLRPARGRGRMAAFISALVLVTGVPQLYAQGRTATTSLGLQVRPAELLQHQDGSGARSISGGHARASYPTATSTSGNLQVTVHIQPSIQLAVRSVEVGEHVAGGNEEATVRIPIPLDTADSAQGSTAEIFPLATVSRVASLANSNGYTLEATWAGSQECVVNIDGVTVARTEKTDITQAKAMGDPYGTETEHLVRVIHPSTHSGCQGSVLVLTARPKRK